MSEERKQQILQLWLTDSALDAGVIAWAFYDGWAAEPETAGQQDEPPYITGFHALQDGWRLLQPPIMQDPIKGQEHQTGFFKYGFFFEKMVTKDGK